MNLYYAVGGGLGHLTRARAVLHTLGIENDSVILTASPFAADCRVCGNIRVIKTDENFARNRAAYRDYLEKIFAEFSFENIFLDAFPAGIVGEFCDFDFGETNCVYVARRLKWKNYSRTLSGKIPRFKKTFVLEMLEPEQQEFINENSAAQVEIRLKYPLASAAVEAAAHKIIHEKSPFWLVVHAGNIEETNELMRYAEEMREIEKARVNLILISPNESSYPDHYNLYPASILFPDAARIFTAGGFNSIAQTAEFSRKHFAVPFERRYDDQFLRVARGEILASSK